MQAQPISRELRRAVPGMQISDSQFGALAENIPALCWIADPDGYIVWYNRRWYEYTGTTPPEMEGWGWQSVHDPRELPRVLERWRESIATGQPFEMVFPLRGADGQYRPFLTRINPAIDAAGAVTGWFGVNTDISEQLKAEEAVRDSEARFRILADTMPQMVWSATRGGYHDYYNARWYEFTGVPVGSTDGEAWKGMHHPDDQELALARWQHSLATGEPYEIEYRLRHHSGEYRWTLGRALPLWAPDGTINRWFGTCTDIHDAKHSEEEHALVAKELSHRIKNIFSVISGLISLSAKSFPEATRFAAELKQRIAALGRAHDFVQSHNALSRPKFDETRLFAMLRELLAPYQGGERILLRGQDLPMDDRAATPLALLFHELATNAAKYGALSVTDGRVTISGAVRGGAFEMKWREEGGPFVESPTRSGFGSALARLSIERQLGGTLNYDWSNSGLTVTTNVPLTAMMRPKLAGAETA